MAGFQHHPKRWVVGDAHDNAVYSLRRYFQDFTGAWFDRLVDVAEPNRLTAADLVAVSMLSVTVPARAAVWILGDGAAEIESLLREVPDDVDLWQADEAIADDSPLAMLWLRLQAKSSQWEGGDDANGVGPVIAGKLLATKRPRLVPVYDAVVAEALGSYDKGTFWRSWQLAFDDPELLPALTAVQTEAAQQDPAIAGLSALRVLDIVIWHQNR